MGTENSQCFDLPILLRFNNLDIVRVAKNNSSLRVGEYFNLLSKVENNVPKTTYVLQRIISRKSDENDIAYLGNIKELLENIGCKTAPSDIDEIIKACKDDYIDFAADNAKKALEDFNKLQARITAAKKTGKKETSNDVADDTTPPEENYNTQSLKDTLVELEKKDLDRKLCILAIDDSPVMLRTIISVLNDEYKVYGMHKPTMLKKFLEQISPDLFLLDYEMPEINGFECIPIIRSFDEHKDTPIIFLTSMGTVEHVSAAHSLGACDFVVKPFQGDNLREKVTKHIVRKKLILF